MDYLQSNFYVKGNIVKQNFIRFLALISMVLLSMLSSMAAADDKVDYLLGAGDSIRINVFQNPELTTETRVSESGAVSYPLIGEIKIGGNTIRDAEQKIARALISGGFVQQPQVNIVLLTVRGNQVAVLGMVTRPGRYPLETFNTHLSEMIAMAGGVAQPAGNGLALITGMREGKPYKNEVDLAALFLDDKKSQDILVNNGDVIYIIPGNRISVLGQVVQPGRFSLEGFKMRLTDALAMAGGVGPAGSDKVVISGVRDGQPFNNVVDIPSLFLSKDAQEEPFIMAGDQIYVHRAPVFYIYGEAQRSNSYKLERDMTVVQALAQGGGPTVRGTQRSIKLYRRNDSGVVEKTSPKLTDFVQANDVLYVEESLF
ncbi:MAG: polysaccharide biosynthesis/export family protein [Methylophilaceae bacterium]